MSAVLRFLQTQDFPVTFETIAKHFEDDEFVTRFAVVCRLEQHVRNGEIIEHGENVQGQMLYSAKEQA